MIKPYQDTQHDGYFIRDFFINPHHSDNVDSDGGHFVWHRDKMERIVEVLKGEGWKFQFDNRLPFDIFVGDIIHIPKEFYHRIIIGKNSLQLKIIEF